MKSLDKTIDKYLQIKQSLCKYSEYLTLDRLGSKWCVFKVKIDLKTGEKTRFQLDNVQEKAAILLYKKGIVRDDNHAVKYLLLDYPFSIEQADYIEEATWEIESSGNSLILWRRRDTYGQHLKWKLMERIHDLQGTDYNHLMVLDGVQAVWLYRNHPTAYVLYSDQMERFLNEIWSELRYEGDRFMGDGISDAIRDTRNYYEQVASEMPDNILFNEYKKRVAKKKKAEADKKKEEYEKAKAEYETVTGKRYEEK